MEPSDEVRSWVSELLGMARRENGRARSLAAWAVLGPALTAVHGVEIPVETEPATQMGFAPLEELQPKERHDDRH